MPLARRFSVASDAAGIYHCVSRCVRRAWLCGFDAYSGIDYSHRKRWVEERLQLMGSIFAVGLYGFAVMSNHLHVVLRVDPAIAQGWTDLEVAQRWARLFPCRDERDQQARIAALAMNPERLTVLRQRLADLSWFMRCLNEPLARAANGEDGCTGRFWEGRYKCQALLDDGAALTAMAYVDLNPVRAGITTTLEHSRHTSVLQRIEDCRKDETRLQQPLAPLIGVGPILPLNQGEYLALVHWTGQQLRPDKRGAIPKGAQLALNKTGYSGQHWPAQVKAVGSGYWRVIGSVEQLMEKAEAMGQRWLKGIGTARRLRQA